MRGLKYIAPIFDGSGYGAAARNCVLTIYRQGYPITVTPIEFQEEKPELGADADILHSLCERDIEFNKVIIHSTPDIWRYFAHQEPGKYLIGQTAWESTRLHNVWVKSCTFVDEVWVPSQWNVEVFRDSDVDAPVYRIPHALATSRPGKIAPLGIEGIGDEDYVFYSIFEWNERKNPYGLLAAYFSSFCGRRDVVLVLKTYLRDNADNGRSIWDLIRAFKREVNLHHYPRVVVLEEMLDEQQIHALHMRGDCFVLLQRAEGWGLPHFEAATIGNPVITTGFGGQTEFLGPQTSFLVDYTLRPVTGISRSPFYQATQFWSEPDLHQAGQFMRRVYEDPAAARQRGRMAQSFIKENFTCDRVGAQIVKHLDAIDEKTKTDALGTTNR